MQKEIINAVKAELHRYFADTYSQLERMLYKTREAEQTMARYGYARHELEKISRANADKVY